VRPWLVDDEEEPLGGLTEPEPLDRASPPFDADGAAGGGVTPLPDDPPEPELELPPPDDEEEDEEEELPEPEPEPEPELELLLEVRGTAWANATTGAASARTTAMDAAWTTVGLNMASGSRGPRSGVERAPINTVRCKFTASFIYLQSMIFPSF
jgi:hypothetical protein